MMNLKKNKTNFLLAKVALVAAVTLQTGSTRAWWLSGGWGQKASIQAVAPVAKQTSSSWLPEGYGKAVAGYVFDRNVVGSVAVMAALGIAYDVFLGNGKTQELVRQGTETVKKAVETSQNYLGSLITSSKEYLGSLISSEHKKTRETVEARADRLEQQNKVLGKKLDKQGAQLAAIAQAVGVGKQGPKLWERVCSFCTGSSTN